MKCGNCMPDRILSLYRSEQNSAQKSEYQAVASVATVSNAAAEERSYILTTATTGGTYYPVGVALATLIKVKLQNAEKIDVSAISSAGSGENVTEWKSVFNW